MYIESIRQATLMHKDMANNAEPSENLLLGRKMLKEFIGEEHLKSIQTNVVSL